MSLRGLAVGMIGTMLAAAVLTSGACGGKAVIDGPGPSGNGGAASASTSSSGMSSSSSGVGASGPGSLCQEACAQTEGCFFGSPDSCVERCEQAGSGCQSEQDTWLQCLTESGLGCTSAPPCFFELQAFLECTGVLPGGPVGCGIGTDSCLCDSEGGDGQLYSTICDVDEQSILCQCYINDEPVGVCGGFGDPICDPLTGCCTAVFFVPGP